MEGKSIFRRLLELPFVRLTVSVPKDVYLRAKLLCEDIEDVSDDDYSLHDLVELLWSDFLDDAIYRQDMQRVYKLLLEYDRGTPNVRISHYSQENVEEVPLYPMRTRTHEEKFEQVKVKLDRELALRGEILLADIYQIYVDHPFSLERVLEILIIDFMVKYSRGETRKLIQEYKKN